MSVEWTVWNSVSLSGSLGVGNVPALVGNCQKKKASIAVCEQHNQYYQVELPVAIALFLIWKNK